MSVAGTSEAERLLVERSRRGDARAYEDLVRLHQAPAFRVACVLTGSPADAEEVVQDSFVKAWRAIGRFRPGAPFRPWLLGIVANEAKTSRRSAGRRQAWTARAAQEQGVTGVSSAPSAESVVLDEEERELLLEALGGLPARDRMVLELRYLLGLSEAEMAAALGIRPGTVKSRLSRALQRLREDMKAAAVALVALIVALAVIGTTVQPVRAQIEDFLGIAGGEKVVRVPKVVPAPRLDLGRVVTREEAERSAGFRVRLPRGRTPTGYRIGGDLGPRAISIEFGRATVLTEIRGESIYPGVKRIAGDTRTKFTQLDRATGIWLGTGPRILEFSDKNGVLVRRASALPSAGVLLWERGNLAFRLETRGAFESARRLALLVQ